MSISPASPTFSNFVRSLGGKKKDGHLLAAESLPDTFELQELPGLQQVRNLLEILRVPYPFTVYSRSHPPLKGLSTEVAARLAGAWNVALGDLHSSYRKLVETLVAAKLVVIPQETAKDFVKHSNVLEQLRQESPQDLDKILETSRNIQNLIPQFKWTGGKRQLILIGDVLADRGPLDSLTLAIVDHLTEVDPLTQKEKYPERIIRIASNHDHDAFRFWTGLRPIIPSDYMPSLILSTNLIATDREETQKLKEQYARYLGASKLMHYNPATESLYTHAAVSKEIIKELIDEMARQKRIPGKWTTPGALLKKGILPELSEALNRAYQNYVKDCFASSPQSTERDALEKVLEEFLWTRDEANLSKTNRLPFYMHGVRTHIHGHDHYRGEPFNIDKRQNIQPHQYVVVNLDQEIRKSRRQVQYDKNASKPKRRSLLFVE